MERSTAQLETFAEHEITSYFYKFHYFISFLFFIKKKKKNPSSSHQEPYFSTEFLKILHKNWYMSSFKLLSCAIKY